MARMGETLRTDSRVVMDWAGRNLGGMWTFLVYVAGRFNRDGGLQMASALAYTSLLAMVPLLVIGLAMLAAFPVFEEARERLQQVIFENFVPEIGEVVQQKVSEFVANAAELTAFGVIGLGVTAIVLLLTIESSLNVIFRVDRDRPISSRLFVYWTILTLGPLLLGASFSLTGYFSTVRRWAEQEGIASGQTLANLLPTLLIIFAFALLYFAVPNRRVRVRDAVIGGLSAGILFTLLRWLFAIYIGSGRTYETVYGALSAIPIFLAWMYFSWTVVLFGAELTAALPEWRGGRTGVHGPLPARQRLSLTMEVLALLYFDSLSGTAGVDRATLLDRTAAPEEALRAVLKRLQEERFVAATGENTYVLSRDAGVTTVYDLVRALDLELAPAGNARAAAEWRRRFDERVARAGAGERDALGISLRELFSEPAGGKERPPAPARLRDSR